MGVKGSNYYDWKLIDVVVVVAIVPLLIAAVVKFVWIKLAGIK